MNLSLLASIGFLCIYIMMTYGLSIVGMRKMRSLSSFAIGNKDMSPILVGLTMAASIASTATFVINPGFIYTHGVSAWFHYGVAAWLGIAVALTLLSKRFLSIGERQKALTIPHWIYERFHSRALSLFFAIINLFTITFVVLILVGCALIITSLFGISTKLALVLIILFVFSYVLLGGSYAHAYTNAFQAVMMALIAIFLFIHGWFNLEGGFFHQLSLQTESFRAIYNPDSDLYFDFFSVFGSSFIITFALMMQPHILSKVLYLKNERSVKRFLITTLSIGAIFSLMLIVGFFAKFQDISVNRQDMVVTSYLTQVIGGVGIWGVIQAFVAVALLAAGMSTLDGILVALSSMVVHDLYLPFRNAQQGTGLVLSRWVLVGIGAFSLALAWNPPRLVGIFAQQGVYGLAAASVVPICWGTLTSQKIPVALVWLSALSGLSIHLLGNLALGISNPSVSASYGILVSASFAVICHFVFLKTKEE